MDTREKVPLIRAYANAEVSWHSLQNHGFSSYLEVLAGLGEFGLRPPMAEMSGPNVESRQKALAILRAHYKKQNNHLRIIVTDTAPLITLAVANELDVLLLPKIPVEIPDAVYREANQHAIAHGAARIRNWINGHTNLVRIVPTQTAIDRDIRIEQHLPTQGMREQAAMETVDIFLKRHPKDKVLVLFEDTDIVKTRAYMDERANAISTGDFLRELEYEKLIKSAEGILDKAAADGRAITKTTSGRSAK